MQFNTSDLQAIRGALRVAAERYEEDARTADGLAGARAYIGRRSAGQQHIAQQFRQRAEKARALADLIVE